MTKNKPGIFDPWRQEAPAPTQATAPQPNSEDPVGQVPTRFAGRRGGLVVWLPGTDDEAQLTLAAQTNILVALETLLADPELFQVFHAWNVSSTPLTHDGYTKISSGARSVFVKGDYEEAIDAVTFALRAAARTKASVSEYLVSLGIRPYVR
jgi:hypothetical protein